MKSVKSAIGLTRKTNLHHWAFSHTLLKIGGLIVYFICTMIVVSMATATPSRLITLGTFSPYYSPKLAKIETGTSISWTNPTGNLHSITHDACKTGDRCAFDSRALGPNQTFTVINLLPGRYSYHCTFHPIMRGTLIVMTPAIPTDT